MPQALLPLVHDGATPFDHVSFRMFTSQLVCQGTCKQVDIVPLPTSTPESPLLPTDKSQRSVADVAAEMGVGCTRPEERVLAAVGILQGAPTRFEECHDVPFGGVLCALPALAANGLLHDVTYYHFVSLHGIVPHQNSRAIAIVGTRVKCGETEAERNGTPRQMG